MAKFTVQGLQNARKPATSGIPKPLVYATQQNLEGPMNLVWGQLPADLKGHVFFLSPNGSPNGTYPIPETLPDGSTNPEFGAPMMGGNGYAIRVDFDQPGKVNLKAGLLKAPTFFADEELSVNETTDEADSMAKKSQKGAKAMLKLTNALEKIDDLVDDVMGSGEVNTLVEDDEVKAAVNDSTVEKLTAADTVNYLVAKASGNEDASTEEVGAELESEVRENVKELMEQMVTASTANISEVFHQLIGLMFGFNYSGVPRSSLMLGFSQQLNTAYTPVNFTGQPGGEQLLSTSDFGRHWYLNPKTLSVSSPLVPIEDYALGNGPFPPWIFPIVSNTAHPCFDPITKEYFGINYVQKLHVSSHPRWNLFFYLLASDDSNLKSKLASFLDNEVKPITDAIDLDNLEDLLPEFDEMTQGLTDKFMSEVEDVLHDKNSTGEDLGNLAKKLFSGLSETDDDSATENEERCYFTYYKAGQEDDEGLWKKVKLIDADGNPVVISQAAHQLGVTEDYVFVVNAAFKTTMNVIFSFDFYFNYDIVWNAINTLFNLVGINIKKDTLLKALRILTTSTQDPYTDVYVVKRSDLMAAVESGEEEPTVTTTHFRQRPEYVHALANYSNPNSTITFYTMNNAALCVAEWIRWYDKLKTEVKKNAPLNPETIGLITSSSMDVGRLCKVELNMETGEQTVTRMHSDAQSEYNDDQNLTKPSTWGIGLYAYKGYLSTTAPEQEIKNIFVISGSPESQRLTSFIYQLYKMYPNRLVQPNEMIAVANRNLPMCLIRLQTADMTLPDHFVFPNQYYLFSTQFVPKPGTPPAGLDGSLHGYVVCLMENQEDYQGNGDGNFYREVWVFDAADLKQGPVCVLAKPDLNYCFGLHSAWMPELTDNLPEYNTRDMKKDYGYLVKKYRSEYLSWAWQNKKILVPVILIYFRWLNNFLEDHVFYPFQEYRNRIPTGAETGMSFWQRIRAFFRRRRA